MLINIRNYRFYLCAVLILLITYSHAQIKSDSLPESIKSKYHIESVKKDSLLKLDYTANLESLYKSNSDTIEEIRFAKYKIEELPNILQFKNLKLVDFRDNQLKKIRSKDWPEADSLEKIILCDNEIRKIRFKKSQSVRNLDLANNDLKRIPASIRKLKSLAFLDISKNEIRRIPCFIKRMDSLQELTMNYNQLKKLSKRDIRKLKHLKSIHIGANGLTSIPENIGEIEELETLNLGKNFLSDLPASFAKLDKLQHLIFYQNNFKQIPEEVFQLNSLTEIDFYHNQIEHIPEALGSMKNLKQIFLSYNKIEKIPDTIYQLDSLKALYIHHNEIIFISTKIIELQNLLYLDLGYNKIFEIPDLSAMTKLTEIDLQENLLTEFPYELAEIDSLRKIYLMGNSFVMTDEELQQMQEVAKELGELGIRLYF